jgi:hypothetical protein
MRLKLGVGQGFKSFRMKNYEINLTETIALSVERQLKPLTDALGSLLSVPGKIAGHFLNEHAKLKGTQSVAFS